MSPHALRKSHYSIGSSTSCICGRTRTGTQRTTNHNSDCFPKTGNPVSMTFAKDCLYILKESGESGNLCIDLERVEFGAKGLIVRSKKTSGDSNCGNPKLRQEKGPLPEEDVAIFMGLDAHGHFLPWSLDFIDGEWKAFENPTKLPQGDVIASSAHTGSIHLKAKGDQRLWRVRDFRMTCFESFGKAFSRELNDMFPASNPSSPQAPRPEKVTYREIVDDVIKPHSSKCPKIVYIIDHISQKFDVDSSKIKRFIREPLQTGVWDNHYKATPNDGS